MRVTVTRARDGEWPRTEEREIRDPGATTAREIVHHPEVQALIDELAPGLLVPAE